MPVSGVVKDSASNNLLWRLIGRVLLSQLIIGTILFIFPGTPDFCEGWAFFICNLGVALILSSYLYTNDRDLLARRMLRKEARGPQKIVLLLLKALGIFGYMVCAADHRFSWSRTHLFPVPAWLTWLSLFLFTGFHLLLIPVYRANRFAASVVRVEARQTVVDSGPYRFVRHPMYSISIGTWLWIPLALGSLFALPAVLLIASVFVSRLLNEEKLLRAELPGYAEYCQRTRYRLVPAIW